jgi:hypothetical protein
MKEFNLSKERSRLAQDNLCNFEDTKEMNLVRTGFALAIRECNNQDKQFIKKLKEESRLLSARNNVELKQMFFEKIKELAGDNLCNT